MLVMRNQNAAAAGASHRPLQLVGRTADRDLKSGGKGHRMEGGKMLAFAYL